MGSGQTVVRFGRGLITYPTGQPSESLKYIETGTSLYVGLRRLTKLVCYIQNCKFIDSPRKIATT
jgi:hypothetical protein